MRDPPWELPRAWPRSNCSTRATSTPRRASHHAVAEPMAPAPITKTSTSLVPIDSRLPAMGDLARDTAVEPTGRGEEGGGTFTAKLSRDWEIWGPMGGYVASVALRAAGAVSPFSRPASFFCQYLSVATFDAVDLRVTTLRSARTAAAHRVEMTQGGKPILEATVWSAGDVEGLEH